MKRLRQLDPGELRAALRVAEQGLIDSRFLHRLHVVLLVSLDCSCQQVAAWFGDDPRSVQRWSLACERDGVEGLRNHHAGGRPGRLTAAEQVQMMLDLSREPISQGFTQTRWSGKLVALHLERRFGVALSQRRCQALLQQQKRRTPAGGVARLPPEGDGQSGQATFQKMACGSAFSALARAGGQASPVLVEL